MTKSKQAFPHVSDDHEYLGMTLREWYAGQALPLLTATAKFHALSPAQAATLAFEVADAMIEESAK